MIGTSTSTTMRGPRQAPPSSLYRSNTLDEYEPGRGKYYIGHPGPCPCEDDATREPRGGGTGVLGRRAVDAVRFEPALASPAPGSQAHSS